MRNNDWQEAYFDLVNKVECECVQQGDLVPIWDQFKAMSAELAKFKALAETLAGALPDDIDLFRIIRAAGRSNAAKAQAVYARLSEALREYKEATNV